MKKGIIEAILLMSSWCGVVMCYKNPLLLTLFLTSLLGTMVYVICDLNNKGITLK